MLDMRATVTQMPAVPQYIMRIPTRIGEGVVSKQLIRMHGANTGNVVGLVDQPLHLVVRNHNFMATRKVREDV